MVITELQDPEDNISGFECIYSGGGGGGGGEVTSIIIVPKSNNIPNAISACGHSILI